MVFNQFEWSLEIWWIFHVLLLGPAITISASSWLVAWIGIELSFYAFIPHMFWGMKYFSASKEAALKYFCIQALSSGIIFFSGLMAYMEYSLLFSFCFVVGLCIKMGIFPGHFWVPSVTSGLRWFPIILLLSHQKMGPMALLVNFMSFSSHEMNKLIVILGGLSSLVGGYLGNNFESFTAMMGASSVAHTGWVVIGMWTGSPWFYFAIYVFIMVSTFLSYKYNEGYLSIMILSMSGLPPFILFVGKWSIISSAFAGGLPAMYLLLPILGSVLSLSFYLKFFYSFYLNWKSKSGMRMMYPNWFLMNLLGFMLLFFLFFGDRL